MTTILKFKNKIYTITIQCDENKFRTRRPLVLQQSKSRSIIYQRAYILRILSTLISLISNPSLIHPTTIDFLFCSIVIALLSYVKYLKCIMRKSLTTWCKKQ